MKCPSLTELPLPPDGKTGWPWTEESQAMPDIMCNGEHWPRVTVVTPSFNQAQFLEETIRSVLLQGYPDLEYIIMDGGSTDGSVEIIKKYEPWLTHWESEKDRGQAHAINKGWQRSTGEILAWINSDDSYTPNAFQQAVEALLENKAGMVYSDCFIIDERGNHKRNWISEPFDLIRLFTHGTFILQQTTFFNREVLEHVGWLDESLQMIMDTDLFIRIGLDVQAPFIYLPGSYFAKCREHSRAKTSKNFEGFPYEQLQVWKRVFGQKAIPAKLAMVRKYSYSRVYFRYAIAKAQQRQGIAAINYLLKSLQTCPKYTFTRLLDTLWIIKEVVLIPWR